MDQVTKHKIAKVAEEFIRGINRSKVCELATSFHPEQKPCRMFAEPQKGSYNICYPIIFDELGSRENSDGEKWVVRIPLLPQLAFPEEKMRSEIATMKYIAEKTTIPIPHLFGYSITTNNILGLPFMLLQFVEGKRLHDVKLNKLGLSLRKQLFYELSEIYIQLFHQRFDRIGSLTLDENDENWTFSDNRPLTIDINDQELCGLNICRYIPPNQVFRSAIDYVYFLTKSISNQFTYGRDTALSREHMEICLYVHSTSPAVLMSWIDSTLNHGPFVLIHGDLRPPNIIIDDNFRVLSVLDWEFSHTVPLQMFVPPYWLNGQEVCGTAQPVFSVLYGVARDLFLHRTWDREEELEKSSDLINLPLTSFWQQCGKRNKDVHFAHGLLNPQYFMNIYWDGIEDDHFGEGRKVRKEAFQKLKVWGGNDEFMDKKMLEYNEFEKEAGELGIKIEVDKGPSEEKWNQIIKIMEKFNETDVDKKQNSILPIRFPVWNTRWSLLHIGSIGIGVAAIATITIWRRAHR